MKLSNSESNEYNGKGEPNDPRVTVALPRTHAHRNNNAPAYEIFEDENQLDSKDLTDKKNTIKSSHTIAYIGVVFFLFLLYLRPNDAFPAIGNFQIIKITTVLAVGIYLISKLTSAEKTEIVFESKMMLVICLLAILFAPLAVDPGNTISLLKEVYITIVIIFILLTNLLDTRGRILKIWIMICGFGAWLSYLAVDSYLNGDIEKQGRIVTGLGGMFGNPNNLAATFNLIWPLTVILAILSRNIFRYLYLVSSVLMLIGIFVTESRGGFLGMVVAVIYMAVKLSKGRRVLVFGMLLCLAISAVAISPSKIAGRLGTIVNTEEDATGSAQERQGLLVNAVGVFLRRPIIGVGMSNIYYYSSHKMLGAHNAYVEIAAELGIFGLIAYLALIGSAYSGVRRIEKRVQDSTSENDRQLFYMCVGLKTVIIAYLICSLFGSLQYQWYIYLPVAYAVAVRRIDDAESEESGLTVKKAIVSGTLVKVKRRLKSVVLEKNKKSLEPLPTNKSGKGIFIK